jgi:NDP-sugar pyrophosphorylase family protein
MHADTAGHPNTTDLIDFICHIKNSGMQYTVIRSNVVYFQKVCKIGKGVYIQKVCKIQKVCSIERCVYSKGV